MSEDLRNRISLYLYGELPTDEEARFEEELAASPQLAAAVEEERQLIETLRARKTLEVSHEEVDSFRAELMQTIRLESAAEAKRPWYYRIADWLDAGVPSYAWQGALAVVLVAAGFWGGRTTQQLRESFTETPMAQTTPASYDNIPDVRSISTGPGGSGVEIVVEERRTIRGNPQDPQIQSLLIAMSRSSNEGMRLETIDLLRDRTDNLQVRQALVQSLLEDENGGVRLAALDALAPHIDVVEIRRALMSSLRQDSNPGVRVQAIQLLTANPDRELVDVLQDVVRYDPNSYVRLRSEQTLAELNASIGLY